MSNEIVHSGDLSPEAAQKLVADLAANDWLPRITLNQPLSDAVEAKLGEVGDFMFGQDTNMGKNYVAIPVAFRPHALLLDNQRNVLAESFDPESDTFKEIQAIAAGPKDDKKRPAVGIDFLEYVVGYGFGIYFYAKTARSAAKPVFAAQQANRAFLQGSKKVEKGGYRWWVPTINNYEGQLAANDRPTDDEIATALLKFQTTSSEDEEGAEKAPEQRDR